jgi:hypothetical protein
MCPRNGITWWTTPAGAWRLIYGRFPGMLVTTRPPTGTFHDEVMLSCPSYAARGDSKAHNASSVPRCCRQPLVAVDGV